MRSEGFPSRADDLKGAVRDALRAADGEAYRLKFDCG
jgi:hypothetical protein